MWKEGAILIGGKGYRYWVKHYEEGSQFGIDGGRISKLTIKVGGIITTTGLNNCGVEHAMATIERFFTIHEMWIVHPRPEGPVLGFGASGSQWAGREDGKVKWRRISDDDVAAEFCQVLGRDMVEACKKLA